MASGRWLSGRQKNYERDVTMARAYDRGGWEEACRVLGVSFNELNKMTDALRKQPDWYKLMVQRVAWAKPQKKQSDDPR